MAKIKISYEFDDMDMDDRITHNRLTHLSELHHFYSLLLEWHVHLINDEERDSIKVDEIITKIESFLEDSDIPWDIT